MLQLLNLTRVSFFFIFVKSIHVLTNKIVCLGERQKLSVKIESRSVASKGGILLLESQTEGMTISQMPKVSAILNHDQEVELDMLETGEIILVDLDKNDFLELFVMYEGPYTEFDYRVTFERKRKWLHPN